MDTGVKRALLVVLALGSLAAAFADKPIPQDPRYHGFADQRTLLGVPHFMDVASNLPFLVAGSCALSHLRAKKDLYSPVPEARPTWVLLAITVLFTTFGFAVCHLTPSDATLFIDRLPMAVGFTAVLAILLLEWVDRSPGGKALALGVLGALLEEVDEGRLEVPERLLGRNAGHLLEPGVFGRAFQFREKRARFLVAERVVMLAAGVRPKPKPPIVDIAAGSEDPREPSRLSGGRIESEGGSPLHASSIQTSVTE